jgi:hypothetical protein
MLTFLGKGRRLCDGISRRNFLKIGGLGVGGFTLPDLLRSEAQAANRATGKSVINIFLTGGPPHIDMFDLKPEAPKEYRGEYKPIATNVPGIEICQLMPELAALADKYTIIRSMTGMNNEHSNVQSDTGWSETSLPSVGGRPSVGAVMSKLWGPSQTTPHGTAPTFVDFAYGLGPLAGKSSPGFLGQVHASYRADELGRANLTLNQRIGLKRLDDRAALLDGLDRFRRESDSSGMMNAMDSFSRRAVSIVTSGKLAQALDVNKEDPKNVARYGIQHYDNRQLLIARRLVEAGVRYVSMTWAGHNEFDSHGGNFRRMDRLLPPLSQGLSALIEDLDARGRLDDTIIMLSGEFGRTPRINPGAGRDHWPSASFFFLAGGGMPHGQVIGATNSRAEVPTERPIHLQHVFHTLYHQLGIDANTVKLVDPNGRPQYLLENRELIRELI